MTDILITELDSWRLNALIGRDKYDSDLKVLDGELDRADIVDFPEIPPNLITMNTRFRFMNTTDNQFGEMTLVYPEHADLEEGLISVTSSLGAAFLGLRENDEIDWTFPDGKIKKMRVLEILYQPEASGDLHL